MSSFGKTIANREKRAQEKQERIRNDGVTDAEMLAQASKNVYHDTTVERGSMEYNAMLDDYSSAIANNKYDMYGDMVKNQKFLDIAEEHKKLVDDNRYFNFMLMRQCAIPFAQGINATSMVQAMGMYAGMMIGSKSFRATAMSGLNEKVNAAMLKAAKKLEKHCLESDYKAMDIGDRMNTFNMDIDGQAIYNASNHNDSKIDKSNMNIGRRWVNYVKKRDNFGKEPLNPDVYSMKVMKYQTQAYHLMREPGADINKVEADLQDAVSSLNACAQKEGLVGPGGAMTQEELDKHTRHFTMEMSYKHPELHKIFDETAYGSFVDEQGNRQTICSETGRINTGKASGNEYEHIINREIFASNNIKDKYFDGTFFKRGVQPVTDPRTGKPTGEFAEFVTPVTGNFHVRKPMSSMDDIMNSMETKTDELFDGYSIDRDNPMEVDVMDTITGKPTGEKRTMSVQDVRKYADDVITHNRDVYTKDSKFAMNLVADDYGTIRVKDSHTYTDEINGKTMTMKSESIRKLSSPDEAIALFAKKCGDMQVRKKDAITKDAKDYSDALKNDTLDEYDAETVTTKCRAFHIMKNLFSRTKENKSNTKQSHQQSDTSKRGHEFDGTMGGFDDGNSGSGYEY